MLFWERFSGLCDAHNLKPNRVAIEIGVASGTLSKWKMGKTFPNGETLIKISEYFECSIDYLLGLSKIIYPAQNEISQEDISILSKIKKLNADDRTEVMMIIDFRLNQQEKRKSSHSESETADDVHNRLA